MSCLRLWHTGHHTRLYFYLFRLDAVLTGRLYLSWHRAIVRPMREDGALDVGESQRRAKAGIIDPVP